MLSNSNLIQYSPNSEESDEQPLDFSKTRISSSALTAIGIKHENNGRHRHSSHSPEAVQLTNRSGSRQATNCFTTPSPSPPEHHNNHQNSHHSNQVLCQLLTGNLIPTSTGKLISANNSGTKSSDNRLLIGQLANESSLRFNGLNSQSSPVITTSSPPNAPVMQALSERHNSLSPTGSASPIGLGPLNQVEMHFAQSPNASGVDRFGTSGGLLTTTSTASAFAANDSAKRALKYSRPFKAYPRDPLSIPMSYYGVGLQMPLTADAIATQSLLATASDQAYLQFREQMLVSRKNSQEPPPPRVHTTSSSLGSQSVPKNSSFSSTSSTPEMNSNSNNTNNAINAINTNGNNINNCSNNSNNCLNNANKVNNNGNNNQNNQLNVYLNRSITPPKEAMHALGPKLNGSSPITAITTASQINSDETSQYSNGNSSGNSSSGEADVGSMSSTTGATHSGHQSDGQSSMRKRGRPLPEDLKDDAYWERRRKNNEAAKRSRDARRAKEDEIAIRAAFLEQENLKLRCEIAQLKTETTKLRCLLYNS